MAKGPNRARVVGAIAYIELTDRRGRRCAEAVIDAADLDRALAFGRWHERKVRSRNVSYAGTATRRDRHVMLHRFLLDATPEMYVDHRDGDGLNCRRENLRVCTPMENAQNRRREAAHGRSGVRGVYWHGARGAWCAAICVGGQRRFLGTFGTVEEANTVAIAARREFMPFATD